MKFHTTEREQFFDYDFASVRIANAENSAGLKEKKKVSCVASASLCARTRPVHRSRMELFVGYSRRVEDEWF